MYGRIILTVTVLTVVFFGMQMITHGVGPAIQDDLAVQQVTDPGATKLLRTTQETQNHSGFFIALGGAFLMLGIWKKPIDAAYKKAVAGNTESGNTESVKKE